MNKRVFLQLLRKFNAGYGVGLYLRERVLGEGLNWRGRRRADMQAVQH